MAKTGRKQDRDIIDAGWDIIHGEDRKETGWRHDGCRLETWWKEEGHRMVTK